MEWVSVNEWVLVGNFEFFVLVGDGRFGVYYIFF